VYAVVPAAGQGARMQEQIPKQYLPLQGKPVIERTLRRLLRVPGVDTIVVVLAPDDEHFQSVEVAGHRKVVTALGGATRAESVQAGLDKLATIAPADALVLVHDAARPCIRVGDVIRLIEQTAASKDGGLLSIPVADTLKRGDAEDRVEATIERSGVWRAATPQLFRADLLSRALADAAAAGHVATDEAFAMECAGYRPHLVSCHRDNIKITTPGDLELAGAYLELQKRIK
jgi:2-C-methyl-D-erythritol 4-phosphate cytidylyltransferase